MIIAHLGIAVLPGIIINNRTAKNAKQKCLGESTWLAGDDSTGIQESVAKIKVCFLVSISKKSMPLKKPPEVH